MYDPSTVKFVTYRTVALKSTVKKMNKHITNTTKQTQNLKTLENVKSEREYSRIQTSLAETYRILMSEINKLTKNDRKLTY